MGPPADQDELNFLVEIFWTADNDEFLSKNHIRKVYDELGPEKAFQSLMDWHEDFGLSQINHIDDFDQNQVQTYYENQEEDDLIYAKQLAIQDQQDEEYAKQLA